MDYLSHTKDHIGMVWKGEGNHEATFCCPDNLTYKRFHASKKTDEDKKIYLQKYRECLENEFTNPETLYEESRRTLETIAFKPFWIRNINAIASVIVGIVILCLSIFMFYCFLARE